MPKRLIGSKWLLKCITCHAEANVVLDIVYLTFSLS